MGKKIKLELTEAQFIAIINVTDDMSVMIGGGADDDTIWIKNIKLIDRMLKNNGYKRNYL
jgi:hypothetical protein